MKIIRLQEKSQDKPFAKATFENEKTGDLINIKISHTAWKRKTNKVSLDGITDYLKNNGRNFVQRKVDSGELRSINKDGDLPDYVIATPEYNPQANEILVSFTDLEKTRIGRYSI